ncbi:MAG: hypothetical protein IKO78_02580 [Bacilli bacterium]|nr:hypothetical protein [Bacilli bacterium]
MNNNVLKYLKEKGYSNVSKDYYSFVELWESYWKNDVDYMTYKDEYNCSHRLYTLGMAKRVCEDWASVISSEQDEIITDKDQNKKYVEKIVKELKLKQALKESTEIASWSGTCGAIIRLFNIKVVNGKLEKTDKTRQELIKVNAKNIIPLTIENGDIKEVAFVSSSVIDNKKVSYIELHQLTDEGYKISNIYLDEDGKEVFKEGVLTEYETKSNIPLFSILEPPKVNSIENNNGLGMSVYADALPQIEATDITYNNFVMDFYLGGKKVFYNKKIVGTKQVKTKKEDGTYDVREVPVYPDDVTKQQWKVVGDGMENINDNPLIHEYNPELRVSEDKDGIQFALDILSFKTGFGTKYYQFNGSTVVTATQYMGDRQDLVQNAKKYRDNLNEFSKNIVRASLLIGRMLLGEKVTEDCNVKIANVDGFLTDTESLKEQYRQEIAMGIRQRWEYRMKFFGEDEKTAKEIINDDLDNVDLGGEEE